MSDARRLQLIAAHFAGLAAGGDRPVDDHGRNPVHAVLAGVSPKAVRLYEARGILPPAERTEAGYRTYTEGDVELLRFVRRARTLGLRLEEIRHVVDLERQGAQPCSAVIQLLERHLAEIERAMRELRALRRDLTRALETTRSTARRGENVIICPIIKHAAR